MIEIERAGFLPLALACLLVGRNATALDWLALLKTSAEINAALCPLGAAFEVCHDAPDQTQLRCGTWRRVVRAARRCLNLESNPFPKSQIRFSMSRACRMELPGVIGNR